MKAFCANGNQTLQHRWKNCKGDFLRKPYLFTFMQVSWLNCELFIRSSYIDERGGCPRGIMANVLDCDYEVCEFEHRSCSYIYFWTNTLGKGMLLFMPTRYESDSTNTRIARVFNIPRSLICHSTKKTNQARDKRSDSIHWFWRFPFSRGYKNQFLHTCLILQPMPGMSSWCNG